MFLYKTDKILYRFIMKLVVIVSKYMQYCVQ